MGTNSSSLHIAGAPVLALQGQRLGRKGMDRKKGALAGLWVHCTDARGGSAGAAESNRGSTGHPQIQQLSAQGFDL